MSGGGRMGARYFSCFRISNLLRRQEAIHSGVDPLSLGSRLQIAELLRLHTNACKNKERRKSSCMHGDPFDGKKLKTRLRTVEKAGVGRHGQMLGPRFNDMCRDR